MTLPQDLEWRLDDILYWTGQVHYELTRIKTKSALTQLLEAYTEDRVLKQLSRYMEQRCGCLNCDLIADDYAKLKLQGD
jgi:hypothetical protein